MDRIKNFGIGEKKLKMFGYHLGILNMGSDISEIFTDVGSYREFYERFAQYSYLFEKNFVYQTLSQKDGLHIYVRPTDALLSLTENTTEFCRFSCEYRRYAVGSLPLIAKLFPVNLEELRSFHRGDALTHYYLDIPESEDKKKPSLF